MTGAALPDPFEMPDADGQAASFVSVSILRKSSLIICLTCVVVLSRSADERRPA